jgi:hypothetical protein
MLHGRIVKESSMLQGIGLSLSSNSTDHSPMSTSQAAIPKKRKVRSLYDGSNGVSYGRQSGLSAIRIAKPFIHPLDLSPEEAAPGHQTKRPHYSKIKRAQFSAFEEQAMREAAARKAGEII